MRRDTHCRNMRIERVTSMEVLHLCPAKLATGGTEGIHHLVSEMNKHDQIHAQILYVGNDLTDPQPNEYAKYECEYITEFPADFKGCIIFPEVYANQIIEQKYSNCMVAVNWQGVDVYYWNNSRNNYNLFLKRADTIHLTMSQYGIDHLKKLGIDALKVEDCINDVYFQQFSEEFVRGREVLYNPSRVKLTQFQKIVMSRCTTEYGIKFKPLQGYTQDQLIDIFRHSRLYIDFGDFSGRERLPREAVMCGCCILTSTKGTAKYDEDNGIQSQYKIDDTNEAIRMIKFVLDNYDQCKDDFNAYRTAMRLDSERYPNQVKEFCNEILNHNSCI